MLELKLFRSAPKGQDFVQMQWEPTKHILMKHSNVPYSYSRVTFALSYAFREEFVRNSAIIWPLPSLVFLMTLNLSTCGEICICSPFFCKALYMFLMSVMRVTRGKKPHDNFQKTMKPILNIFLAQVAFGCFLKCIQPCRAFQIF